MIVFEYFYDKMDVFGPEMDNLAARELEMEDEKQVSLFTVVSVSLPVCRDASPPLPPPSLSGTCTPTLS